MKKEEMIVGNYYYIKAFGYEYVFLLPPGVESMLHLRICKGNEYYSSGAWHFYTDDTAKDLREATSEEQAWLSECIKQDKTISRDKIVPIISIW